jgi:hypothetical protein
MDNKKPKFGPGAVCLSLLILTACGGGDDPPAPAPALSTAPAPTPAPLASGPLPSPAPDPTSILSSTSAYSISGVATFEGSPAESATVSARCASGVTGTATTSGGGRFVVELGQLAMNPFPCMLAMNHRGASLHGYARVAELSHNINLLTELTLAKVLLAEPATIYAAFGTTVRGIASAASVDAPQFVEGALQSISGYRSTVYSDFETPSPFTSEQARADREELFNAVAAAMRITGVNLSTLRSLVVAAADRRETFRETIYKAVIEDRAKPTDVAVSCTVPVPVVGGTPNSLTCTITGKRLTHPVLTPVVMGDAASNLGLSVSRGSQRVTPRSDPMRPFRPAWCSALAQNGTFESTDSTGRASDDPLGVFAEKITLACGRSVDFEDDLLAEVTIDDGNREGPAGWPLVGASTSVSSTLARSVIHSARFACESAYNPPPFPVRGPWAVVSGEVSLMPGHALIGLIARPGLPEATVIDGWYRSTSGDGVGGRLGIACNYGPPFNLTGASCTVPGSRVPFLNDVAPAARALSLYTDSVELGIGGAGTTTPLEIRLFIIDALGIVQQRLSGAVSCPGVE